MVSKLIGFGSSPTPQPLGAIAGVVIEVPLMGSSRIMSDPEVAEALQQPFS